MERIENAIRKRWFWGFAVSLVFGIYIGGGLDSFSFEKIYTMFRDLFLKYEQFDYKVMLIATYLGWLSNFGFLLWASFYFPYTKKGVKFLFFTMLCSIFSFCFWSFKMFNNPSLSLIASLLVVLYQFINSVDLFQVNLIHKLKSDGKHEKAEKIARRLRKRFKRYV